MDISRKIDHAANIVTIITAVLLSTVLIKTYVIPAPSLRRAAASTETGVGTSLKSKVPGVDWSKNGRTLVLAISTQCHFCKDSTPFYKKLEAEVGGRLKTVAVVPQTAAEAEQYLNTEGVHVDQVKQADFGTLGVRGTPTLLLVNKSGVVTKVWAGKVQPEQEQQVLAALKKG